MFVNPDGDLITKIDAQLARQEVIYDEYCTHRINNEGTVQGEHLRDKLFAAMTRGYTQDI